uniref:Ig-like domain-containing protein n=1 Tax=Scophthalmus maximus TaxID=52904 RepID=A0A8D2ZFS0_SCOMX
RAGFNPLKMICPLLLTLNFLVHGLVPGSGGNRVNQPSSLLVERGQSTISCSHSVSSYNVILWYQQSAGDSALKLIGYILYANPTLEEPFQQHFNVTGDGSTKSQLRVLKLRQPQDSGVYYCAASSNYDPAYFGSGTKLTVLGKKTKRNITEVSMLGPSSRECRNLKDNERRKTLLCVASDFYPDHVSVSWRVGGQEVSRGVATDNAALRQGENYKITSRLRVSAEDWFKPETEFECIVSFFDGTGNTNHSASIFGGKGLSRGT